MRGEDIPGSCFLAPPFIRKRFFSFSFSSLWELDWLEVRGEVEGGGGEDRWRRMGFKEEQAWGGRRRCELTTDVQLAARRWELAERIAGARRKCRRSPVANGPSVSARIDSFKTICLCANEKVQCWFLFVNLCFDKNGLTAKKSATVCTFVVTLLTGKKILHSFFLKWPFNFNLKRGGRGQPPAALMKWLQ